jgi:2-keto-3-deoxy-L-rhamnonate aldolase RhmA
MNGLKEKFKQRNITIGSWITFSDPSVAEIMANAGFDWLAIDMEHSGLSINQVQELIRTIDLCNVPALVRVTENNQDLIKRVMDMGALGVIVPHVNSKEDALKAVNAVKYPPYGNRGIGLSRAQKYGYDIEKYSKWNQENSIVIIQVEHIEAVDNFEDIMNVEGVDGFIIGLYDLSGSLNCIGDFDNPKVKKSLEKVFSLSKKNKYLIGQHVVKTDQKEIIGKVKKGVKLIGFGTDFLFLGESCRKSINQIKNQLK